MRRRQHVNPLGVGFETFRGQMPAIDPERPVEVEIGCADAQYLFERARAEPDRQYIGLEIRDQLVDEVNQRAAAEGLPVVAVFSHANHHLSQLFRPGQIDRVYVNFPDPWFKRRHHKRRLMDEELGRDIHQILKPGGDLLFQSDVWGVALDALAILEGLDDRFVNRAGAWSFWKDGQPFSARSWREQNCEHEGLPIWRILYRRI